MLSQPMTIHVRSGNHLHENAGLIKHALATSANLDFNEPLDATKAEQDNSGHLATGFPCGFPVILESQI